MPEEEPEDSASPGANLMIVGVISIVGLMLGFGICATGQQSSTAVFVGLALILLSGIVLLIVAIAGIALFLTRMVKGK
jgi:hypothetical protein